jgi:hypothetical protein
MTFLEDADAMNTRLQMKTGLFDFCCGNLKIDIKQHLGGQPKLMRPKKPLATDDFNPGN